MRHCRKNELIAMAYNVRKNILTLAQKGGCFIGSAFSCIEIIIYLYEEFMKFNIHKPLDPQRDFFFLSKGHAVPTLYSYFVEKDVLAYERLKNHQSVKDDIYLHPSPHIPGVEFHSGSLGHLLSVAVGSAINFKRKNLPNRVIIILGDGELNEGSIWEALLIASAQQLSNLIIIIDRNGFQANFKTEDLLPLEPLSDKLLAFGCNVLKVNGHDFKSLSVCFSQVETSSKKPLIIIAKTVRGKGIPSLENNWDKWFVEVNYEEKRILLEQLQYVKE